MPRWNPGKEGEADFLLNAVTAESERRVPLFDTDAKDVSLWLPIGVVRGIPAISAGCSPESGVTF